MSIASIAKILINPASVKNVPMDAAKARLMAEEMKLRTSALGIAAILTKSKVLQTVLDAKIEKERKKHHDKEEEEKHKLQKSKAEKDFEFKAYTLRTMFSMRKKIDLLTNITEKNNRLVESLVYDLGKYKRNGKALNLKNPGIVKFPVGRKTVKGRIDQINDEIEKIKQVKYRTRRTAGVTAKIPTKKEEMEQESGGGMGNLGLLGLLGAGGMGGAFRLLSKFAKIGSLAALPFGIANTIKMFNGDKLSENPIDDYVARKTTPLMTGLGTYSAVRLGTAAYENIFAKPAATAEPAVPGRKVGQAERVSGKLESRLNKELEKSKKIQTELGKPKYTKRKGDAKKLRSQLQASVEKVDKLKAKMGKVASYVKTTVPAGALKQVGKFEKIAATLMKLGKRFPALGLGYLAYKVSQMSTYVSDLKQGRATYVEYKKNMTEAYADIASTGGSAFVGALLGGLAGTAFPVIGNIGGALVGGLSGLVAGWFMDDSSTSKWLGEKMFAVLNDDKSTETTKTTAATASSTNNKQPQKQPASNQKQTNEESTQSVSEVKAGSAATGGKATLIRNAKGEIVEIREGGNVNWRNNNPGNIRPGAYATAHGATGVAGGFAVFPTMEAGRNAADELLRTGNYKNLTIAAAIARWAPRGDNNDPDVYANYIQKLTGLDVKNQRYVDLSAADKGKVLDAMNKVEGGKPGISRKPTQEEIQTGQAKDTIASSATNVSPPPSSTTQSSTSLVASSEPTTVKTKSGLVLSTAVNGEVVKGSLTNEQYATLVAEADKAKPTWSMGDPSKDRLIYLQSHYAPEVVRAFEKMQSVSSVNLVQTQSQSAGATSDSSRDDSTAKTAASALVIAAKAVDRMGEMGKIQDLTAVKLEDTRKVVASGIGMSNAFNPESTFSGLANRR